jgi:hypothetical protein
MDIDIPGSSAKFPSLEVNSHSVNLIRDSHSLQAQQGGKLEKVQIRQSHRHNCATTDQEAPSYQRQPIVSHHKRLW